MCTSKHVSRSWKAYNDPYPDSSRESASPALQSSTHSKNNDGRTGGGPIAEVPAALTFSHTVFVVEPTFCLWLLSEPTVRQTLLSLGSNFL
jgi:hypothetical protein